MQLSLRQCLRRLYPRNGVSPPRRHRLLYQNLFLSCDQRCYSTVRSDDHEVTAIVAFADGACRGNPGHGACGALIVDRATQTIIASRAQYLSAHETNNTTEYHGLLLALDLAESHGVDKVEICMDSELVIKQMRGEYRVKAPHLRALFQSSKRRCCVFQRVHFTHVPRAQNALADRLANEALDQEATERAQDARTEPLKADTSQ